MNTLILSGRLAADPEAGRGATAQARFRLAVDFWNSKTKTREADFITCIAFDRTAETILKYCHKGSYIVIRGKVKPRKWTGSDGEQRHELSVIADELELGPKTGASPGTEPEYGSIAAAPDDPFDLLS